jgi:N-acetylneuraminic acid mutarotase
MRVLTWITYLFLFMCFQNCRKETTENLDPLYIDYFHQDADTIGGIVIIYGKGFSSIPEKNKISFNTTQATPFYSTHDTLKVKVPVGATSGKIHIQVYKQTAISNDTFYIVTGRWKQETGFPGGSRIKGIGFSVGGKGYVSMGTYSDEYKDLWQYDAKENTWTRKSDFPATGRVNAFCFVINNKAYVGCGYNDSVFTGTNDFYEYDPLSDKWTRKADFPVYSIFKDGVGLSINGKGYVITGEYTNYVYEYTPQTNSWSRKHDFPGKGRSQAVGFVCGNKGYLISGNVGDGSGIEECWEYSPNTDTWTQKAPIPTGMISAVGFSLNGKGYVGNGAINSRPVWKYDPTTDKWERKTNFPGLSQGYAVSFVIDTSAYIATGYYGNDMLNEVWQFNP